MKRADRQSALDAAVESIERSGETFDGPKLVKELLIGRPANGAPCVSGGRQVRPHLARIRAAAARAAARAAEAAVQPAPPPE